MRSPHRQFDHVSGGSNKGQFIEKMACQRAVIREQKDTVTIGVAATREMGSHPPLPRARQDGQHRAETSRVYTL